MHKRIIKEIEYYLYNYNNIDTYIEKLRDNIKYYDYNQTYKRWIKNKSSGLEEQAIKNINIKQKISKINKWKRLITKIMQRYKKINKLNYEFINLKYIKKVSPEMIQEKLNITLKEQRDKQKEILKKIFLLAKKNNMLK